MIVAQQKRKENIIEYILYMWQVEDLIRANKLDIKLIDTNIITKYTGDANTIIEIRDWWDNLVEMMQIEKKETSGHLQININTVNDVHQLHLRLMKQPSEIGYNNAYRMAVPLIKEFELKSAEPYTNDIELCLTAIYSSFLLKLQKKEVTPGTAKAIQTFSKFLAILAKKYKLDSEGKLEME